MILVAHATNLKHRRWEDQKSDSLRVAEPRAARGSMRPMHPRPQILICVKTIESFQRRRKEYEDNLKHLEALGQLREEWHCVPAVGGGIRIGQCVTIKEKACSRKRLTKRCGKAIGTTI